MCRHTASRAAVVESDERLGKTIRGSLGWQPWAADRYDDGTGSTKTDKHETARTVCGRSSAADAA